MRIRLDLAFDGSAYHGWQSQTIDIATVQSTLRQAVSRFCEVNALQGAGRTDKGVHAFHYTAHLETPFCPVPMTQLPTALNGCLPKDIRILQTTQAPEDFHATRDAKARVYLYLMHVGSLHPLYRHWAHVLRYQPCVSKMREASQCFLGTHHFRSFCHGYAASQQPSSWMRRIDSFRIRPMGNWILAFIQGEGFLRGMIRHLMGATLAYADGTLSLADIRLALCEEIDFAIPQLPAQGLSFRRALYGHAWAQTPPLTETSTATKQTPASQR